jgi:hypothetical protein
MVESPLARGIPGAQTFWISVETGGPKLSYAAEAQ